MAFLPLLGIFLILIAIVVAFTFGTFILRELRRGQATRPPASPPPAPQTFQSTAAPIHAITRPTTAPMPKQRADTAKLYRRANMTRAEGRFYDFISETIKGQYLIQHNVQLKELFQRYGWLDKELYMMHVRGHVDFVLLEPTVKNPIIAIELDGTTHNDPAQIDRDRRKDELFRRANMRLLRFQVGKVWGDQERQAILDALPRPLDPR